MGDFARYDVNEASNMVLSAAFHHGPEVWEFVPPYGLENPWQRVAKAMFAIQQRGDKVDANTLTDECQHRGFAPQIASWMRDPTVTARDAANAFMDAHAREVISETLTRGIQWLDTGTDHWRVADDVGEALVGLARPMRQEDGVPWHEFAEVMAFAQVEPEWVIPGLLGKRERLVLTGKEGWGKSTLIYQLVLGAAFGVSPINLDVTFDPQRVLVLDVENTHETQVAAIIRRVSHTYGLHVAGGFVPAFALMKARQIDLLSPTQRGNFQDAVDAYQPDLIVMGAGYKLVDSADDWRAIAQAIQRTADHCRAISGCAVIVETHAGHGEKGDRNGYRPDGSSFWLRWPEFGHGLAEIEDYRNGRMVEVVKWRGDRVTSRTWPGGWRTGAVFGDQSGLPWIPMDGSEVQMEKDNAAMNARH
jgi:replicative DNA helicase